MKIIYLCSKHPPLDIRVYSKISVCLAERSFSVVNINPNAHNTISNNIQIIGYRQGAGFIQRIISLYRLYRVGKSLECDYLFAPEPDSLVVAFVISIFTGCKVVFDCHEWYQTHFTHVSRMRNIHIARILNKFVSKLIEVISKRIFGIITINDAMTDYYFKFNKNVVTIPSLMKLDYKIPTNKDKHGFYYFGQFGEGGQEKLLLETAYILKKHNMPIKIIVLGGFKADSKKSHYFYSSIDKLQLHDNLQMLGWKSEEESFNILNTGLGGIMRFDSDYYKDYPTLPNKIFEYMALGLLVICSKKNQIQAKIVDENNCGVIINNESPDELAQALMYLYDNENTCQEMCNNSLKAIKNHYNWSHYGDILVNFLKQ